MSMSNVLFITGHDFRLTATGTWYDVIPTDLAQFMVSKQFETNFK